MDLHAPSSAPTLDQQLQQYLRGAASRDRDVERIGPFLATFDPHSTIPYLSYAIPTTAPGPRRPTSRRSSTPIARHDRLPRLEYLPVAAPDVEAALVAGGFAVEARLPVMTCAAGAAVDLAPDDDIVIAAPATDEDFRAMRAAQHAAFSAFIEGHDDGDEDDDERARATAPADRRRRPRAAGARRARPARSSRAASPPCPGDGVTEIGGIGVLESHRRRGIAGAITAAWPAPRTPRGTATVWLTPGDDGAHRVYARAGFTDTTCQVHLSRPS